MSSLSSVLGGLGFGAYASANSYLDAFAQARHNEGDCRWQAVNWDGWIFDEHMSSGISGIERVGMTPEEGVEAFTLALHLNHLPQLVNSTGDLTARIEQWLHLRQHSTKPKTLYERPSVQTAYVEPATDIEKRLVIIWHDLLGIEQVGIHDNFFELGGDSILITRLHAMMRSQLPDHAQQLSLKSLFERPTIAGIAQLVDEHGMARQYAAEMAMLSLGTAVMEEGEI